jgi:hypothetical protein
MQPKFNKSPVVVWMLIGAAVVFWLYTEPQFLGYTILAICMPFYFFGWNAVIVLIGILWFWGTVRKSRRDDEEERERIRRMDEERAREAAKAKERNRLEEHQRLL